MKRVLDLSPYKNVLPYDSEIFGVYQPLLGWRSKRIQRRMHQAHDNDKKMIASALRAQFKGRFTLDMDPRDIVTKVSRLEPARLEQVQRQFAGSFALEHIGRQLPELSDYDDSIWHRLITEEGLKRTLQEDVVSEAMEWYRTTLSNQAARAVTKTTRNDSSLPEANQALTEQLNYESAISGYVLHLSQTKQYDTLKSLFYKENLKLKHLLKFLQYESPLDYFDPFKDIDRASLSPLGIVHLFRQYFYEFDTFLGPPVSHVWLSPGSTVELVEISQRKTITERSYETETETTVKTEREIMEQDEISDAVKEDNKSDTKFGVSTTANQSWIGGSASASASIDLNNTQQKAREETHKRMRKQTEKLSTEIRKNYKTTFKTITEVSDLSSKRYILNNTTDNLINYELRRKMRQVGVQVQDIGTYLCWQTFVDDPGKQLGIAKLVHIAKDPELGSIPPPESIPMPTSIVTKHVVEIPFVPKTEDTIPEDDMDEAYKDGIEVNQDTNEGTPEKIQANFHGLVAESGQANYQFGGTLVFEYGAADIDVEVRNLQEVSPGKITYDIHLNHVNFRNNSPIRITANVTWSPTAEMVNQIDSANKANANQFSEQTANAYKKAFVEAASDRINKMSNVESRKFEDLREEERIVVYRSLIQDMLTKHLPMPDSRTRHVVSELLNTIFDIDKMLYFVSPEWWRPRVRRSHQVLGGTPKSGGSNSYQAKSSVYTQSKLYTAKANLSHVLKPVEDQQIASSHLVSWGGVGEGRSDNYYITDKSEPAKLGSSLGWLLQLDGDDLRNAFLNAPWVKAVIPIRPGKEQAAVNWLQRLHVEGTEGLDDKYSAPPEELAKIPHTGSFVTIRDAINYLADLVSEKHESSLKVDEFPTDEINDDNKVSATPIDKVYEHGFYPLQGGFKITPGEPFEVFDQWTEILPTDQVVPVEVKYNPITGRQI